MNYVPTTAEANVRCDCGENALPSQPLVEVVKETGVLAEDILAMVNEVNELLFADRQECCETEAGPKCFREEMLRTRCKLAAACEGLAKLRCLLGP